LNEALTNKEKYTQTGEDAFGNKQYGFVNERDQTINGSHWLRRVWHPAVSSPLRQAIDSNLTGSDYLKQFSPEVQAAVNNYIDGKSTPLETAQGLYASRQDDCPESRRGQTPVR